MSKKQKLKGLCVIFDHIPQETDGRKVDKVVEKYWPDFTFKFIVKDDKFFSIYFQDKATQTIWSKDQLTTDHHDQLLEVILDRTQATVVVKEGPSQTFSMAQEIKQALEPYVVN